MYIKKLSFLVFLALLMSLLATLTASAAPRITYQVIPLGDFWARAINSRGEVAGRTPDGHAAIWYRGQIKMLELDADWSEAFAINDAGTVLVTTAWNRDYRSGYYLVHRNGRIDPVDVPLHSTLHGVNNASQVAGEWYNDYTQRGFVWENGQTTFLTNPSQGFCTMTAINNGGAVAGLFWGNGPEQPFLTFAWDREIVRLETPDGEGRCSAINDFSQVSGYYSPFEGYDRYGQGIPSYRNYPAVWTDGQLQLLDSGGFEGQAMDINNRGEVVGSILPPTGAGSAVLWRENGMVYLDKIVDKPVHIFATGINLNNAGQIICYGGLNGKYGYFFLQPRYRAVATPKGR